ncbi:MAG TPA: PH domain-containing protein [Nitrososphaera sp.]|nr:PH domain-containing protein [Nitrososphaera sp.]
MSEAPEDVQKLLDKDEQVLLYIKQKKYHPSINKESMAVTTSRVIFLKPSMLQLKKSYSDYSYADIYNIILDKGPLRSTLKLKLKLAAEDLLIEDIPNDLAQEAFKIIRERIDQFHHQP